MSSIGKKILSAFIEMKPDEGPPEKETLKLADDKPQQVSSHAPSGERFKQYFEKLFTEANLPGPDYFEFSKMVGAMKVIADEQARYTAAFAGLQVQGLDRNKLLSSAIAYIQVLDSDATNFDSSVDAALQEKVYARKQDVVAKAERVAKLTAEIEELQKQMALLNAEIAESEKKIESNSGSYRIESAQMKTTILNDIEKIKQYIH